MSFSFLHVADVHLDSPMRGWLKRGEAANAFVDATRRAFENVITTAIEREVAFVLVAGDLYDGDWRDWATGQFAAKQFIRLERVGIPAFVVKGNHDAVSVVTKGVPLPANVTSMSTERVQTCLLEGLGVAIHGLGFAERHVEENVVPRFPRALPDMFNIGLLHTSASGRDGHGVYAPCRIEDLASRSFDYWALGHVHEREIVHEHPHVVFPGNVQGRHAREGGAKGCSVVTVRDRRVVRVEHVACDVVRFETREVDLADAADLDALFDRIREAATLVSSAAEGRPVALRLRLVGATRLHGLLDASRKAVEEGCQAKLSSVSDDLVLEKVVDETVPDRGARSVSVAPHFDSILAEVADDPAFLEGLANTFRELGSLLPADAIALVHDGEADPARTAREAVANAMAGVGSRLRTDVRA